MTMVDDPTELSRSEHVVEPTGALPPTPAQQRFDSCRWRAAPTGTASYCSHRDVQPYAGTTGFHPESWCLECRFYKPRRTPRKPDTY